MEQSSLETLSSTMSGLGLKVTIWMHGRNERRSEITIRIPMPPGVGESTPGMHEWTARFMLDIADDLKHTRGFRCEGCGEPSRETFWNVIHWTPVPEPAMVVWSFALCAASSPCMQLMRARDVRVMVLQQPPPHFMSPPPAPLLLNAPLELRPKGFVGALSGSCAGCREDETAGATEMNKCAACGLTRYCRVSCQRADWPRHKKMCKAVQDVKKAKGRR
ncbi:hypothetical protein B0H17DRAFT_1052488 [Mycena rosella]|uniref:MYND-type domain-containing protein n=1 Tax=Mycena rosella TaxID=1033263 RepID=A0AAD7GIS6_MYCRO|nr:hypothetical protein B0H17DRAFT_1052488 [Mycena rosella]